MDLSGLSSAELQTMKTNLLTAHASALSGSYTIEGLSVDRDPESILKQLEAVLEAIAAQGDETGGLILVQFEEPGGRQ